MKYPSALREKTEVMIRRLAFYQSFTLYDLEGNTFISSQVLEQQ
jgi:hypothetical protein